MTKPVIQFTDICLITNDVLRLRQFYEVLFGVEAEGDEFHSMITLDGLTLTFDSAGSLKNQPNFAYVSAQSGDNTILGFHVAEVDEEFQRLKALGVTMLNQPTTYPWGARSFQFKDPDGNIINFRTAKRCPPP